MFLFYLSFAPKFSSVRSGQNLFDPEPPTYLGLVLKADLCPRSLCHQISSQTTIIMQHASSSLAIEMIIAIVNVKHHHHDNPSCIFGGNVTTLFWCQIMLTIQVGSHINTIFWCQFIIGKATTVGSPVDNPVNNPLPPLFGIGSLRNSHFLSSTDNLESWGL